ncbi:MAG: hypothetical protein ABIK44_04725, partial [candidate division WOR-3 bacterium]
MKGTMALLCSIFSLLLSSGLGTTGQPASISDTILIRDWLLCGPFPVGTREGISGQVEDAATVKPVEGETLRSGLVQGGKVVWHRVRADSLGWIETDYDSVRWDSIQDYYGIAGLSAVGFAYAEFSVPGACRCLAVATKIGGFSLNGRGYLGDVYGNGWFRTPLLLDSGVNRVVLRISGYGDQRVRFLLVPVPGPVLVITQDITAPDIVADNEKRDSSWLGVPVLNTTTATIDSLTLRFFCDTIPLGEVKVRNIPGLGVKKEPVRLNIAGVTADTGGILLTVQLTGEGFEQTDTFRLRHRKLAEPHKESFISR